MVRAERHRYGALRMGLVWVGENENDEADDGDDGDGDAAQSLDYHGADSACAQTALQRCRLMLSSWRCSSYPEEEAERRRRRRRRCHEPLQATRRSYEYVVRVRVRARVRLQWRLDGRLPQRSSTLTRRMTMTTT